MDRNEHFVSQTLLRRFTASGRPRQLQCYDVQAGDWTPQRPKEVFSELGYNQLLVGGAVDNTLEDAFQKVESQLPKSLKALKAAAKSTTTALSPDVYDNMCWYCAFLRCISPCAKAAAPFEFLEQIELELKNGKSDTLRGVLGFSDEAIKTFREEHALGRKIIIDSQDFLQLVYRIQFRLQYPHFYILLRHFTDWTVCNSPIEIPLSDIALLQLPGGDCIYHVLPIGPKLLLKGKTKLGESQSSTRLDVKGESLTSTEAEYWLDAICLSAVTELVAVHVIPDIPMIRQRAAQKKISFACVVDPYAVVTAGQKAFTGTFGLRLVSPDEYRKFIYGYTMPAAATRGE